MPLQFNEIHLWCADPVELRAGAAYAAGRGIVAVEELERLERFRFARDRHAFLATRLLVRKVLSHYEPVLPAAWRFAIDEYGRPHIAGGIESRIVFNLSRTKGLVVCALAYDTEIGIDVEYVRPAAMLDVAGHFFSPAEVAALRAMPREEQSRRFYDYWTLKESYIKARGLGLAIPLDRFAFILEQDRPARIEIDPELGDDADSWQFVQYRPTVEHVVALCVRRKKSVEVVLRWQRLSD